MEIKSYNKNGIKILKLKGNLMGGPDATVLHEKLHSLLDEGVKKVILDLEKVEWINSSGLGILISAMTTMRSSGGNLKLSNIPDRIRNLLSITKLDKIFESYNSIEEAVESYTN